MIEEPTYLFESPIAGESLTGELGAKPYENPPELASVEQALEYYSAILLNEKVIGKIASRLEAGRKVTDMAEMIITSNVASGKHNLDVGVLVLPVIMEILGLVGDMYKVDYDMGTDEDQENAEDHLINAASNAIGKEDEIEENNLFNDIEDMPEEEMPMEEEPPMEQPSGLMARR
jgi:hypothetical protein